MPARASDRERAEWIGVVEAVIALASWCRSLDEFVAKIAEQSASLRQAPENAVVLSTIHSAKGLEWEAVFLVGMEQGVLPHVNNDDLEEERRVAYVARHPGQAPSRTHLLRCPFRAKAHPLAVPARARRQGAA